MKYPTKRQTFYASKLAEPLYSSESEADVTTHLEGGVDSDSNQSFVLPAKIEEEDVEDDIPYLDRPETNAIF